MPAQPAPAAAGGDIGLRGFGHPPGSFLRPGQQVTDHGFDGIGLVKDHRELLCLLPSWLDLWDPSPSPSPTWGGELIPHKAYKLPLPSWEGDGGNSGSNIQFGHFHIYS